MKKMILTALMLATFAANAAEVKVLEASLPAHSGFNIDADSSFQVDSDTREGFVKVVVTEERRILRPYPYPTRIPHCDPFGRCYPGPGRYNPIPTPVIVTLLEKTVKVEGLELVGNKVMYHGTAGAIECGTLGRSRVLRRPTIYLSGKCNLVNRIVRTNVGEKVLVTLKTK